MKAIIKNPETGKVELNTTNDFIFKSENKSIAVLYARNLITNKLINTGVAIYADDISLTNKLTTAIAEIGEMIKTADLANDATANEIKDTINKAIDTTEDEEKAVNVAIAAHLNLLAIEPISNKAIDIFNSIFGEGVMKQLEVARYGREVTPDITFMLRLFCFMSEFSAAYASNNLYANIEEMKGRLKSE